MKSFIGADQFRLIYTVFQNWHITRFKSSLLLLLTLVCLVLSGNVFAHKIDTHVWIAQQVLNDVLPDGSLKLPGFDGEIPIHESLHQNLIDCQDEYRMGSIGPDAFPDMVGGQMTTHPGAPEDVEFPANVKKWQTNDWLKHVLSKGAIYGGCANAFAFGYLTHAASDVFAHTYVNIYAGDIFDFGDGLEEELRHMALEAFVSEHMPPIRNLNGSILYPDKIVEVPAEFVRDTLILNSTVADQYRPITETKYLAAMYDLWAKLNEMIKVAEDLADEVAQETLQLKVCLLPLQIPIPIPCIPGLTDCFINVGIDIGCVDLDPVYDKICLNCGNYNACDIADVKWCEHFNACPLIPTDPVGCTTHEILDDSGQILADLIALPLYQWRDAVEQAVLQYAYTQEEIAREIMRGDEGDPMGAYSRWLTCWGPAFSGAIPTVVGHTCDTSLNVLHSITSGISSFRSKVSQLTGDVGWALDPAQKISEEIKPVLYEGLLDQLDAIAADGGTLDSLILMRRTEHNDGTLNEEFAINSSPKALLEIPDVAARVRAEMMIDPSTGEWSPDDYPVIHNSIALSKLLLLPYWQVNQLVTNAGVDSTAYGPVLYPGISWIGSPFSPLLGMARSIDGSHQWQEYSPPYARDCDNLPESDDLDPMEVCIQRDESYSAERNYGYSFSDPERGFRLWQDCETREKVFNRIFKGPIAPGLEQATELGFAELLPLDHPLRGTTEKPFPRSPASITIDNIPPVPDVAELPPVYASCKEPAEVVPPTATDGCQGNFFGETSDSLSYNTPGQYEITWTFDDKAGNTSYQTQLIIVQDNTPPVLTPPPSITVEQTSLDGTPATLGTATATDNCEGAVTLSDDAPEVFPLGETIVTFTASDESGNSAEQQVTVTVEDTTPPVLSNVPGDVTLEQETLDGTAFDVGLPLVSDICDAEPDLISDALDIYPLGSTEVTFTATDDSGNVATASMWVTVVDTTAPVLESVTPSKDYLWPPNHKMRRVDISPVVTDICDAEPHCMVVEVTSNQPLNDIADGDTEIDWEITGDLKVKLLAERAGNDFSEARIYTITTECTDVSGNVSNAMSTSVIVPVEIEDIGN